MGKLHEVLAVESSQEKTANNMMQESMKSLDKDSLFNGRVRRLKMFREEDRLSETEEHQEVTTTVDENLEYLSRYVAQYWDTVLSKDDANTQAASNLMVDGFCVLEGVPATFLLGLENKLVKLRAVYEKIPTLPPGRSWLIDDAAAKRGVFVDTNSADQLKTRKDPEFRVVYEATENHPAQIVQVERNVDVGRYTETNWCAKLTPQDKADRLARITNLIQEVKRARTRANSIEIAERRKVGEKLFRYINTGEM